MLVQEVKARKEYLQSKLLDITTYIGKLESLNIINKGELYNKALNDKFNLLNKIRSHDILLDKINKDTIIFVGNDEISVYDAVAILKTVDEKIITYSDIISNGDLSSVDFFTLLKQRDDLFEEYIVLYNAIKSSDALKDWNQNEVTEEL